MNGYVSGNFFEALGVLPAAGRLFLRSEGEVLDRDPVMVPARRAMAVDPMVALRQD